MIVKHKHVAHTHPTHVIFFLVLKQPLMCKFIYTTTFFSAKMVEQRKKYFILLSRTSVACWDQPRLTPKHERQGLLKEVANQLNFIGYVRVKAETCDRLCQVGIKIP